jgi:hypothetical protein
VDAFAAPHNALIPRHWSEDDDAFRHTWYGLMPIWANPPFNAYGRIWVKISTEGGHLLLLVPGWRSTLPFFQPMAKATFQLPQGPLFLLRGTVEVPEPPWKAFVLWIQRAPPSPRTFGSLLPPRPSVQKDGSPQPMPPLRRTYPPGTFGSLLPKGSATPGSLASGRGSLLTCGDIEENPGPTPEDPGSSMVEDLGAIYMAQYGQAPFFPLQPLPDLFSLPPLPLLSALPPPPSMSSPSSSNAVGLPLPAPALPQPITTARTAGGKKRRRMLVKDTILCPLGCSEPFSSEEAVLTHVEAIHIQRGGVAPDDGWLSDMGRRMCAGCRRLMGRTATYCPGCTRSLEAPTPAVDAPQGLLSANLSHSSHPASQLS